MINWTQFTVDNGAITELRELLFETVYNDPDIDLVISNETGVSNGKKLGRIYSMGEVGTNHSGCSPTYENINIQGVEKTWELGSWEIAKHICYEELENTIVEESMNTGTERAYLADTPYWDTVLMPLLEKAIKEMFWRIAWFGDKDAKNIANGGNITAGFDPKLFNMCDGLWKRIFAIMTANPGQRVSIAANVATEKINNADTVTYKAQKEAIRQSGAAIKVFDELLSEADSRIFDQGGIIMTTNSLFKALRNDVKNLHNLQLPLEAVQNGISLSSYDGHDIIVLDVWDRLIKKFENNGTALNNPFRALCVSPENLFVGTNDTDKIASLDVNFNNETRYNNIYAASKIGTLVGEDALIQVAI